METISFIQFVQDQVGSSQSLSTSFHHVYVSQYMSIAGFAVLFYDYLLTIATEVQTVWKRPKNVISAVFLANRYLAPVVMIINIYDKLGFATRLSDQFCQYWTLIEVHLHFLSHSSIHALVALRVSAIWGHQRNIKFSLAAAWGTYFILTGGVSSYAAFDSYKTFRPEPYLNICFGRVPEIALWAWVPPLLLEAALFALTVLKAVEQSHRTIQTMPVVYVLYRDGLIYFIVIALCSVFNLVVWRWAPSTLTVLAKYFTFAIVNVMAARIVLNLRQVGEQEAEDAANQDVLVFVETSITFDHDFPRSPGHRRGRQSHQQPRNVQHGRSISGPGSPISQRTFRPSKTRPLAKKVWVPPNPHVHGRAGRHSSISGLDYEMDTVPSGATKLGGGDESCNSSDMEVDPQSCDLPWDGTPRDRI